jgi:hypothetical protein
VIKRRALPALDGVARFASARFHERAKFPLVRVAMTRFTRERGEMKRRLLRLARWVARNAWYRSMRSRQREYSRMLSDRIRRGREPLLCMALRTVVLVC